MVPRLVIFDLDDVLCRYDLGRRLRALSRISGKKPRDIRAAVWDSGFEDESDSGRFASGEAYLAEFASRLGYPISRQEWIAARREAMEPSTKPRVLFVYYTFTKQALKVTDEMGNGLPVITAGTSTGHRSSSPMLATRIVSSSSHSSTATWTSSDFCPLNCEGRPRRSVSRKKQRPINIRCSVQ
jgi:hypothetical protein